MDLLSAASQVVQAGLTIKNSFDQLNENDRDLVELASNLLNSIEQLEQLIRANQHELDMPEHIQDLSTLQSELQRVFDYCEEKHKNRRTGIFRAMDTCAAVDVSHKIQKLQQKVSGLYQHFQLLITSRIYQRLARLDAKVDAHFASLEERMGNSEFQTGKESALQRTTPNVVGSWKKSGHTIPFPSPGSIGSSQSLSSSPLSKPPTTSKYVPSRVSQSRTPTLQFPQRDLVAKFGLSLPSQPTPCPPMSGNELGDMAAKAGRTISKPTPSLDKSQLLNPRPPQTLSTFQNARTEAQLGLLARTTAPTRNPRPSLDKAKLESLLHSISTPTPHLPRLSPHDPLIAKILANLDSTKPSGTPPLPLPSPHDPLIAKILANLDGTKPSGTPPLPRTSPHDPLIAKILANLDSTKPSGTPPLPLPSPHDPLIAKILANLDGNKPSGTPPLPRPSPHDPLIAKILADLDGAKPSGTPPLPRPSPHDPLLSKILADLDGTKPSGTPPPPRPSPRNPLIDKFLADLRGTKPSGTTPHM
ncbi:hypothetical protein JAAARDRAFT_61212 [Jaapia argillacea MUCL 33604]|uniref:Uncharacterized protein n=1 Tax=Jaapia argillacea MUCL 33604 TaxID=933084 RepID=A0A067PQB5_9AGAM|nr:hypothetical protein JAAARDRAFT_61212 [Jaapia argillacea MUCL 33604]